MPTSVLRPSTGVWDYGVGGNAGGGGVPVPVELIGAAPQWGDASDASYTRHETHYAQIPNQASTEFGAVYANVAADFAAVPDAKVIDPHMYVRVSAETAIPGEYVVWAGLFNRVTDERYLHNFGDDIFYPGQPPEDILVTENWGLNTQELALAALRAGELSVYVAISTVWRGGSEMPTESFYAHCYEVWLGVTTFGPSRTPYQRIVQRDNDGLGMTGGRRAFGTKTIQAGNRRGPGVR